MRRTLHSAWIAAAAVVALVSATAAAQQPTFNTNKQVTVIMKDGARHTGTLVYHNDANFNLIENGSEKSYPIEQTALVDFGAGEPTAAELNQLPQRDTTNEMRRHMLVLRDGRVVHGRMYTIKNDAITFNTPSGHQDFNLNDVSRMYINPAESRTIYASVLGTANTPSAIATSGAQSTPAGAIRVEANRQWTDTGVTVRKGDRLAFSTTGSIAIRENSAENIGPDGSSTDDRSGAPVRSMGVGGLIARVGTGAPFPIGSNSQPITMPADGRLYLGVNDSGVSDNSGAFVVTIVR
jgi:hypothetical protein